MSYLLKILMRAGQTVSLAPYTERGYVRPSRGSQASDMRRMVGDMRMVGTDMRKVATKEIEKHERRTAH